MPDDSPILSPAEHDAAMQQAVLTTVLVEHPAQLTMLDLYRERMDPEDPRDRDAVDRAILDLVAAGLVHRNGPFVVPSRAALRFEELYEL